MKLNPKIKSVLIFCLKLVVTLVPAYFVYQNIVSDPEWSVNDLYKLFENNSVLPLVLALLCLAVSNFTACYQWKLLLEKQGVHMTYGKLLKLYHVGLFFITLFALAVGVLFFVHDPEQRAFMWPSVWIFMGFCVMFAGLLSRRIGRFFCRMAGKVLPEKIETRLLRMFERFQKFRSKKLWVNIICLSTVTQSLRIFVHFFCGIAVGVTLSMSWYFYYIPLVAIVSALPISIGGFGPREFLAQSLFARAGVPGLESVVIQLLAYFVSLILSLFGAVVFLMGQKPVTSTPEQTNGHPGARP